MSQVIRVRLRRLMSRRRVMLGVAIALHLVAMFMRVDSALRGERVGNERRKRVEQDRNNRDPGSTTQAGALHGQELNAVRRSRFSE